MPAEILEKAVYTSTEAEELLGLTEGALRRDRSRANLAGTRPSIPYVLLKARYVRYLGSDLIQARHDVEEGSLNAMVCQYLLRPTLVQTDSGRENIGANVRNTKHLKKGWNV